MPKFTQEQIDQAEAEFFGENGPANLEWSFIPGAGNNGPITIYKIGENDGSNETASE